MLFFTNPSRAIETTTGFAARQQTGLQQITSSEIMPEFERSIALCMTEEKLDEANRLLTLIETGQLDLARCAVLLRMLILTHSTDIITPGTRLVLDETLASFIKSSLGLLAFESNEAVEPESLQLAKPMVMLSWCLYAETSGQDYNWFSAETIQLQKQKLLGRLHERISHWLKQGFVFRGSNEYIAALTSLINLYDLVDDEALKTKSAALADIIISDIALENIDGLWGGIRQNTQTLLSATSTKWMAYLLFGNPMPEFIDDLDPGILILCHTGYRLPPLLERLGREQQHRGIYELKHRYVTHTGSLQNSEEVRKYSYITPNFILSSFQTNRQAVPWQARPWDLMIWNEELQNIHIMAFAGKQFFSGKEIVDEEEYDVWNATTVQYKNVLFCQFHKSSHLTILGEQEKDILIPNYAQLPTRLWIPNTLAPVELEKGWLFINTGNVFVALRPVPGDSYWWRTAEAGISGEETASILGFRDLYAAMLIEVETESSRISSYNQFKQQVLDAPLVVDEHSVTYVSRRGDVFYFPRTGGEFLVNGKAIHAQSDSEYEYFSNPFMQSKWDSGVYEAKWNPFSLLIDASDPANVIRRVNMN